MDVWIFCLLGGVVYVDTDAVGQFLISQPLVAGTAAGAVLGNISAGFTVGVLLQLPFLVEIPVGGSKVYLGTLGAYVAAGLAAKLSQVYPAQSHVVLIFAMLCAVLISWGALPLQKRLREFNLVLIRRADRAAELGRTDQITGLNYLSVLLAFLFGVTITALFFQAGRYAGSFFINLVPVQAESILLLVKPALLGAGVGAMLWQFVKRSNLLYLAAGTGLGILALRMI
jgi:mannose/fructose/N-acetylgalactosamine-specific phosphotransferase system component IIC